MSEITTAFYRGNTEVSVDFSDEGVSSDGAVVLLEKLERKHKLISCISQALPDRRDPAKLTPYGRKVASPAATTLPMALLSIAFDLV